MYIYNAKSAIGASACKENEINKINGLPLIRTFYPPPPPSQFKTYSYMYIMHWSQEMKSQTPVVTLKAE